jgi:hypothetical protein
MYDIRSLRVNNCAMEESGLGDEAFAVTKWSAWLVLKDCPRFSGSKPSYPKICYSILQHPLPSSPYRQHTKNTRFTKNLCSQ